MSKETESDEDIDFEAYLENRMEEVGEGHEEDEDLESLLKEAESENKLAQPSANEQKAAQERQEQILKQMNNNDAEEDSMDQQVTEVVSEEKVVTLELWQGSKSGTEDEEEKKINEKLNSLITVKPKEKKKKKVKTTAASASSSVSSSAASTPSTAKQQGSWMAEVIETRISLLVSNVMNRLGKVLTVPSENELIVQQNQELEKAIAAKKSKESGSQEVIDFANLDSSLQRKILLLEKTVGNMGELLELHIRKELRQRKQIKKLQKLAIDNENKYIEETNAKEQLKQKIDRVIKVKNQYKKKLAQYEPSVAEQVDEDDNSGESTSVLSSIWGVVSSYAASATVLPKPQQPQEKQASAPPAKTAPTASSSAEATPATAVQEQQPTTTSPAKKEASSSAAASTPQQTKEGTPVKKKRVPKPQPQAQPQPEASLSEIASSTFAGWKNGALSWFGGKQ